MNDIIIKTENLVKTYNEQGENLCLKGRDLSTTRYVFMYHWAVRPWEKL